MSVRQRCHIPSHFIPFPASKEKGKKKKGKKKAPKSKTSSRLLGHYKRKPPAPEPSVHSKILGDHLRGSKRKQSLPATPEEGSKSPKVARREILVSPGPPLARSPAATPKCRGNKHN